MLQIVEKSREFIIVYKPAGVPSQSDPSGDPDAMSIAGEMLAKLGEPSRLWLIHRLDRTVGGLIVFARTQSAAAELSALASGTGLEKSYLAVAEGLVEGGVYRDYLYKDARLSKAFVVDRARKGVKEASLECIPIANRDNKTLCRVNLHTGRFHQIRVQLSHRGAPLVGDGKYGSRDKGARMPALFAYRLAFALRGKRVEAVRYPEFTEYPWCAFEAELSAKEI